MYKVFFARLQIHFVITIFHVKIQKQTGFCKKQCKIQFVFEIGWEHYLDYNTWQPCTLVRTRSLGQEGEGGKYLGV